jgi:hypothetical protein
MSDNGEPEVETSDEILARRLAVNPNRAKAAQALNISKRTVYRRLLDPAFRRLVARYRGVALDAVGAYLTRLNLPAAVELRKLLRDPDPHVRLRAAATIFQATVNVREHAEFDERLQAVEARVNEGHAESFGWN